MSTTSTRRASESHRRASLSTRRASLARRLSACGDSLGLALAKKKYQAERSLTNEDVERSHSIWRTFEDQHDEEEKAADEDTQKRRQSIVQQESRSEVAYQLKIDSWAVGGYVLFLVLFTLVVVVSREGRFDVYTSSLLRKRLLQLEFDVVDTRVAKTFAQVATLTDVWHFVGGPLLRGLFSDVSYAGVPLPPAELGFVNEENRLIGRVWLQQVRPPAWSGWPARRAHAQHTQRGRARRPVAP